MSPASNLRAVSSPPAWGTKWDRLTEATGNPWMEGIRNTNRLSICPCRPWKPSWATLRFIRPPSGASRAPAGKGSSASPLLSARWKTMRASTSTTAWGGVGSHGPNLSVQRPSLRPLRSEKIRTRLSVLRALSKPAQRSPEPRRTHGYDSQHGSSDCLQWDNRSCARTGLGRRPLDSSPPCRSGPPTRRGNPTRQDRQKPWGRRPAAGPQDAVLRWPHRRPSGTFRASR